MALQVKIGRDWVNFVAGTTLLPVGQRAFFIRALAEDATPNPYVSGEFRAPDGRVICAVNFGLTAGSATIAAGNLAAAFSFDGSSTFVHQGTDNSAYFRASPRVTAGVVPNTNLAGYVVGIRARGFRLTSVNAALGTGTFDWHGTVMVE